MIKKVRLTILLVLLGSSSFLMGQVSKDDISFDQEFINFGTIEVEAGIVIAQYRLTNNGKDTFEISNVDGSCGCTNVRASNRTVYPGETSLISAEFNPAGMIGSTTKKVYVRGNLIDAVEFELKFKANIKSVHQRDPNAYYPGEYGYLVMQTRHLDLSNRKIGFQATDSIYFANDGYRDIVVESASKLPPFISIPNLPLTIKPKDRQFIVINVDTRTMDTIGPYKGNIDLQTNDQFFPKKQLSYFIDFEHDYSHLKKRHLKKAPKMHIDQHHVSLGKMKSGAKKASTVVITNTGKKNLKILRVKTDCTCAVLSGMKRKLAPGESMTVLAQFDSLYKEGNQSRPITIYSNDPVNPQQTITLRATVE